MYCVRTFRDTKMGDVMRWGQIRNWLRGDAVDSPPVAVPLRLVSDNPKPPEPAPPTRGEWEHRLTFRHQDVDWVFIPYKSLEDFDRAVADHRTRIMDLQPAAVAAIPAPCLPPQDAARRFLSWLRTEDRCGEYTDAELKAAYAEHCTAVHVQPSSDAHMRNQLAKLGGVEKRLGKGSNRSRRERPTVWIISPSLAQAVEQRRLVA